MLAAPGLCLLMTPIALLANRDIIALVAQVVPIYAVSHLFESLAVSIMQLSRKHLYNVCASDDDGEMKQRSGVGGQYQTFSIAFQEHCHVAVPQMADGTAGVGAGHLAWHRAVLSGVCYLPTVHRRRHSERKWEPESWSHL